MRRLGWGLTDDDQTSRKKIIILKHMFNPAEAEEDPDFYKELKEDVEQECEKFGPVVKVVAFEVLETKWAMEVLSDTA